jgi:hypothetical protein
LGSGADSSGRYRRGGWKISKLSWAPGTPAAGENATAREVGGMVATAEKLLNAGAAQPLATMHRQTPQSWSPW